MVEFNDVDCECTAIEREVDVEIPWTEEDQAAWIEHLGNPVTEDEIERYEAGFLAWARAQDWAMAKAAQLMIRAASAASPLSQVVGPPDRASNPAHHTQVGGDDSSSDADSHVLTYHQHIQSLICWTSALEVVTAILPAAKSIKKYTCLIGNYRLDLADYPADFTPDYSFQTLVCAARNAGHLCDPVTIDLALKSTNTSQLYKQFSPAPALVNHESHAVVDDEDEDQEHVFWNPDSEGPEEWALADMSARMEGLDPGNYVYRRCKLIAERRLSGWVEDQMYDDMVLTAWQVGYMDALRIFNPARGVGFSTLAAKCVRNRADRDALKASKDYVTGKAIRDEINDVKNKLSRPLLSPTQHEIITEKLKFLQKALGRNFLIKRSDSLDAPLSDGDDSATPLDSVAAGNTGGEQKIAQHSLVAHLLSQLTAQAQDVVRAKYFDGLTHKEIADLLHLTLYKVTTILSAATASMASAVRKAGIEKGDVL